MKSIGKMSWWLVIITGVLIIAAGIFLLAGNSQEGKNVSLDTLLFIVGFSVLVFGAYNLYKAYALRNDHRMFVVHLIPGILDIILLLLMLFIPPSQKLLGIILACWFIVFGLFGLAQNISGVEKNRHARRTAALLLITGLVLLIIPLLFRFNYIILLGICIIVIGIVRVVQGIIVKSRYDDRTSGGRSNLL